MAAGVADGQDFILFTLQRSALLLPKRVLASPDEEARLRRIVRAGAGERAKLRTDVVE